jgi:predicted  nucleic acid-binding Zn-ribbon protein
MSENDGIIRDLEHVVEEKSREIQMLRDNIHNLNTGNIVSKEEFKALEHKVAETESLANGLMSELLDLRAEFRNLETILEKRIEKVLRTEIAALSEAVSVSEEIETVIVREETVPISKECVDEEVPPEEVMIMQPDGTMKREPMEGEGMIVADGRRTVKRRTAARDAKPLIMADEENDTIEIRKKR